MMMMIMKHVNLTIQGDRSTETRTKCTRRRSRKHHSNTMRNISQRKVAASPEASTNRRRCPAWASRSSRRDNYREHSRTRQPKSGTSARTWHLCAESQCKWHNSSRKNLTHRTWQLLPQGSMRQLLKRSRRRSSSSSRMPSRSSSRQHSMMSNLLRVKRISIGVNKIDSDTASSKQARCDEISNEMKSMLIKICWTKDFIEQNTQPAEAVGATKCSQNSATRRAAV